MDALRKKAAQIIFPRLGSNMPPPVRVSEDVERFRRLHEKYQFGGLVLFNGEKNSTPRVLADLQQMSDVPLLVASDIERGAGQQIEGATLFPHAMACAKAGKEAVKTLARVTAQEALACGIHIAFAPVTDVNSNPRNPIIGIRALGAQTRDVCAHVTTFINACREEGLLTTAKHFPGHGDTATDSHAELPVVTGNISRLQRTELPPFEAAIHAGTDLIMTAHVAYPALDSQHRAATLSPPMLINLLRNQLDFQGVVVSDSLIMKAIQPADEDMARYAANLINAGLDILLDPLDPEAMLEGVVRAVSEGLLPEDKLDNALLRIHRLRTRLQNQFGTSFFTHPDLAAWSDAVGSPAHQALASKIAAGAIQQWRGDAAFPNLSNRQSVLRKKGKLAVFVTPYRTRLDPSQAPIKAALLDAIGELTYEEVDATTPDKTLDEISAQAKQAMEILVVVVSRPAAWHRYGLPEKLSGFVSNLTQNAPATLVSLGDPHLLDNYPDAQSCICTYSDVPASQNALVNFLQKTA